MTDEEKMVYGLYEDAPVIRLRIDYILAHFINTLTIKLLN